MLIKFSIRSNNILKKGKKTEKNTSNPQLQF